MGHILYYLEFNNILLFTPSYKSPQVNTLNYETVSNYKVKT